MKIAIVAPPVDMTKGRKKIEGPVAFLTNKEDGTVFPVSAKDPRAQAALSSPRHREIVEKIHAGTKDPAKKAKHKEYLEGLGMLSDIGDGSGQHLIERKTIHKPSVRSRGQGRRIGGMVLGAMSDNGPVTREISVSKLDLTQGQREELYDFDSYEFARYHDARAAGYNHMASWVYAVDPHGDVTDSERKAAMKRHQGTEPLKPQSASGVNSVGRVQQHPLSAKVQKDHPKWRNTVWTKGAVAALANADKVETMTSASLEAQGLSTAHAAKAYLVHHGGKKTVVVMKPYAKAPGADTTSWAVGADGQVERATAVPGVAKRRATSVPYKEPAKVPTQDEIRAAIKRADGVISRALEALGGDSNLSPEVKGKVSSMAMDHHSAAGLSFREAAKKARS